MRDSQEIIQKPQPKPHSKAKTKYIITHEYKGNLSMQTAFQEVLEQKINNQYEQWKDEKLTK
ncbi:MAG: hypothetical protein ACRC9L_10295 [Brevinema sp.]